MSNITVAELKSRLQHAIDQLEQLEDKNELRLQSNTYFVHSSRTFIGISGMNGGYLSLDNIEDSLEEPEDEYYND